MAPDAVAAARRATTVAFVAAGFAISSWASRIPAVRDTLRLSPSDLGLVLLALAAGSLVALPLVGALIARTSSRTVVSGAVWMYSAALVAVAIGSVTHVAVLAVALFVLGVSNGAWDVAMNVQAAAVERMLGRSIMARFHAGFSVGTVAGSLLGAGVTALGISAAPHLSVVAVAVLIAMVPAARGFVSDTQGEADGAADSTPAPSVRAAWTEPRTLMIGLVVLAFAFSEGSGNDWAAVAVIDRFDTSQALGTVVFTVFLAAMTAGRWYGPALLDRWGRVAVLRVLVVLAVVGSVIFVCGSTLEIAFLGALLWGVGTSLGFPVGMSAAADDGKYAATRVGVVSSIGYCAFLAGPPLIGLIAEHTTIMRALVVAPALLACAGLLLGATREPERVEA